jgi:predicted class III extradiol MEMO1 family dioxygenase
MSLKLSPRAEQAADGDNEHVDQIVIFGPIHTGISQTLEMFHQTESRIALHPELFT